MATWGAFWTLGVALSVMDNKSEVSIHNGFLKTSSFLGWGTIWEFTLNIVFGTPREPTKILWGEKAEQLAIMALAHFPINREKIQEARKAKVIPDNENEGASNQKGRENYILSSHWLDFLPQLVFPPWSSLSPWVLPTLFNSYVSLTVSTHINLSILWSVRQLFFYVTDVHLGSTMRF